MSRGRGNGPGRAQDTGGGGAGREADIDGDRSSRRAWAERVREGDIGLRSSPESVGVGKGREKGEKAREETGITGKGKTGERIRKEKDMNRLIEILRREKEGERRSG